MKKLLTYAGFDSVVNERYNKKRYAHYRSFKTKDTLIMYIQIAVALIVSARLVYILL